MIRLLQRVCMGAALLGTLTVSSLVSAKPPDLPEDGTFTVKSDKAPAAPGVEVPPMSRKDSNTTCPYLRKQMVDAHGGQIADLKLGREVLENLERLRSADNLLDLAKDLASFSYIVEAMECCACAAELCPGSPCAERAIDTQFELALGIIEPLNLSGEAAEARILEPGVRVMVHDMLKACHLLMSQGNQQQAAEIARQAYALDPESVQADPLFYKMHLLAGSTATQPAGSNEASEPLECPYCPRKNKPIREILPTEKKSDDGAVWGPGMHEIDCELEIGANDNGEVRVSADCPLSGNVYHLRYSHGNLAIWKTLDAGKTKP